MSQGPKQTRNKLFQVHFMGYAEPKKGRNLWHVSVQHKGDPVNHLLFSNNWHYINFATDNWEIEDEEASFYYLPCEGASKLIAAETFDILTLPGQSSSASSFIGNQFAFGLLAEVFNDCVQVTHLESHHTQIIDWKTTGIIKWAKIHNATRVKIRYYDQANDPRKLQTKTVEIQPSPSK